MNRRSWIGHIAAAIGSAFAGKALAGNQNFYHVADVSMPVAVNKARSFTPPQKAARVSYTVEWDDAMSIRTIQGTVCAGGENFCVDGDGGYVPLADDVRAMLVAPCPDGFVRRSNWKRSKNLGHIEFCIRDSKEPA